VPEKKTPFLPALTFLKWLPNPQLTLQVPRRPHRGTKLPMYSVPKKKNYRVDYIRIVHVTEGHSKLVGGSFRGKRRRISASKFTERIEKGFFSPRNKEGDWFTLLGSGTK
jgi:hypothetical protein